MTLAAILLVAAALFKPRETLFFIFVLASTWFDVFQETAIPILGFLFMPWTTLAYMACMHNGGLVEPWIFLVLIAIIGDILRWLCFFLLAVDD